MPRCAPGDLSGDLRPRRFTSLVGWFEQVVPLVGLRPPASVGLVLAERQRICYRMTSPPRLLASCDSDPGKPGGNRKTPKLFFPQT